MKPILFKEDMVRAIQAGTKTQTRRIIKPLPLKLNREAGALELDAEAMTDGRIMKLNRYGQVGDKLWVRETWAPRTMGLTQLDPVLKPRYRADNDPLDARVAAQCGGWKPSIHMPRWASRITLEITGVRAEHLHCISEQGASAEGVAYDPGEGGTYHVQGIADCCSDSAVGAFRKLWEQINGPSSWTLNPWVWVLEFKLVKP